MYYFISSFSLLAFFLEVEQLKKLLLSIVLCFSIFCLTKVNAATQYQTLSINQNILLNNFFLNHDLLNETEQANIENAYKFFNIDTENYDYIITYRNNYLTCLAWEKNSTFEANPGISFSEYRNEIVNAEFVIRIETGSSFTKGYNLVTNKPGIYNETTSSKNFIEFGHMIMQFNKKSDNSLAFRNNVNRVFESSIDLYLSTNSLADFNTSAYNPVRTNKLHIWNFDDNIMYSISENVLLFHRNSSPSWIQKNPSISYTIELDENEYKKTKKKLYHITFLYENMTDEYYSMYFNLKDSVKKYIGSGEELTEYTINYVNDDAIITAYIFDQEDNVVSYTTVDLFNLQADLSKPYITIMGYNQKKIPNSVAYKYNNTNDSDHNCFYKFGGGELTQESCDTNNLIFRNASYNTSLQIMIKDKNNTTLVSRYVVLNFIEGYPRLEFETYYSSFVKGQILNIKMFDYQTNDTLFYSTDNENWTQLSTQDLNSLTFYKETPVYFKIYRDNEIIADSYYYVKLENYSISVSENNTLDEIKDLTDSSNGSIKSFLKLINEYLKEFSKVITHFYNSLNSNIKACIVSLFVLTILCSIILIARGRR